MDYFTDRTTVRELACSSAAGHLTALLLSYSGSSELVVLVYGTFYVDSSVSMGCNSPTHVCTGTSHSAPSSSPALRRVRLAAQRRPVLRQPQQHLAPSSPLLLLAFGVALRVLRRSEPTGARTRTRTSRCCWRGFTSSTEKEFGGGKGGTRTGRATRQRRERRMAPLREVIDVSQFCFRLRSRFFFHAAGMKRFDGGSSFLLFLCLFWTRTKLARV